MSYYLYTTSPRVGDAVRPFDFELDDEPEPGRFKLYAFQPEGRGFIVEMLDDLGTESIDDVHKAVQRAFVKAGIDIINWRKGGRDRK